MAPNMDEKLRLGFGPDALAFAGQPVRQTEGKDYGGHWAEVLKLANERSIAGQEDAFYVMNISCVLEHYRKWLTLMRDIHPFYAVKANPDPVLLKLLAALGVNFDCASKGEIETILSLGVSPDRIIYANTIKPTAYIKFAKSRHVSLMTFDNEEELHKVKAAFPEAELVLRIAVTDPSAISKLSKKFGCNPETTAVHLIEKATLMGLKIVGISFHVGGGSKNPNFYAEAISHAKRLFKVARSYGHSMRLLDIGGGYPGYDNDEISLQKISSVVHSAIRAHFGDEQLMNEDFRVIAEPGRYFSLAAFTLCVGVIGKKSVPASEINGDEPASEDGFMYYINDGVFGSFNCVPVYKIYPPCIPIGKESADRTYTSKLWGPTCDSADDVLPDVKLPELNIGDWLVFDYMGCYAKCISTEFNGFRSASETFYDIHPSDAMLLKKLCMRSKLVQHIGNHDLYNLPNSSDLMVPEIDSGLPSPDTQSLCGETADDA